MKNFQLLECIAAPESSASISIYELLGLIQHNPKKATIEHLHTLERGSDEYVRLKQQLPCIKPHGTFDGYCDTAHFQQFSGHIYYDVDTTYITKDDLLFRYGHHISMTGKSVGGRGHFVMVKVEQDMTVTAADFLTLQNHIKATFFPDLPIDECGKGVNRSFIIPYDRDVYFNPHATVDISAFSPMHKNEKGITSGTKDKGGINTPYDTFMDIKDVLPHIKWKTEIEVDEWEADYIICEHDNYKLFIPRGVKDGTKHRTYTRMVNALVFNNCSLSYKQVVSFVSYVNQNYTGGHPMKVKEMVYVVRSEYDRIKATGVFQGMTKKYVVTNPDLDPKTRQRAGAKGWGEYKRRNSTKLLTDALTQLKAEGATPTQKRVEQRLAGKLSIATIKRLWSIIHPDFKKKKGITSGTKEGESVNTTCDTFSEEKMKLDVWEEYMRNRKAPPARQTPQDYVSTFVLPDSAVMLRSQRELFEETHLLVISRLATTLKGTVKSLADCLREGEYLVYIDIANKTLLTVT